MMGFFAPHLLRKYPSCVKCGVKIYAESAICHFWNLFCVSL